MYPSSLNPTHHVPNLVIVLSHCDLKLNLLRKNLFFSGNKTLDKRFGASLKHRFFAKVCCKFLAFVAYFSTQNAGRNIQHPRDLLMLVLFTYCL